MTRFHHTPFLFAALITLMGQSAWAQSEVAVFFHGASDSVQVWKRVASTAVYQGERTILKDALIGNDFKVLPLGQSLIGQASGAGVVLSDREGDLLYELDPSRRYRNVTSVAALGFLGAGELARIAIADSYSSIVTVRELQTDQVVWFENMALTAGFAEVPALIAMPGDQMVIAGNYAGVGIRLLNLYQFEFGSVQTRQFANFLHAEAPAGTVVIPELEQAITSLMANSTGEELLVGQTQQLLMLNMAGEVVWVQPLDEFVGVGGEIANAVLLRDGTVVFATFERGAWVEPHINHRLHWYDPVSRRLLASTGPLDAAPAAIDLSEGHGGSGTLDYLAGVGEIEGDPEDLVVSTFTLGAGEFEVGDVIRPRALLVNQGEQIITVLSARILANPGECDALSDYREWAVVEGTVGIYPSSVLMLEDEVGVQAGMQLGTWCARVEVTTRDGARLILGGALVFDVVETGSGSGNVDVTSVPFRDLRDMSADAGDADMGSVDPSDDGGCECSSVGRGSGSGGWMLLIIVGLWARGRVRR